MTGTPRSPQEVPQRPSESRVAATTGRLIPGTACDTPGHARRPLRQLPEVLRVVDVIPAAVPLDPYLTLKALAAHSGLGLRTLRGFLSDPRHPLPHYKLGRVLVRASEFAEWMQSYRRIGTAAAVRRARAVEALLGTTPRRRSG
jgi:hypothetical protein